VLEPSPRFRALTLSELKRQNLLPGLIESYQKIFGDGDIWKEGAYCSSEGWGNVISLEEYNKRKDEAKLRCECGGLFRPCYPAEELEERIKEELHDPEKSILVIADGGTKEKISGFLWGNIAEFDEIEQMIVNSRYSLRRDQGLSEMNLLKRKLGEKGLLGGPVSLWR